MSYRFPQRGKLQSIKIGNKDLGMGMSPWMRGDSNDGNIDYFEAGNGKSNSISCTISKKSGRSKKN